MEIRFYNYNGRPDGLNKPIGEPAATYEGVLHGGGDITRPSMEIRTEGDYLKYNYCHIPEFGRYYFVDALRVVDAETTEVSLRVDVLQTYMTEIMNASGVAVLKENADGYVSSRENVYNVLPNYERVDFTPKHFDEQGEIIMITVRG